MYYAHTGVMCTLYKVRTRCHVYIVQGTRCHVYIVQGTRCHVYIVQGTRCPIYLIQIFLGA